MVDKNSETSVTSVTRPSLLQRMNQRRRDISSQVEVSPISAALIISEKTDKSQLPQLVIDWLSICFREGHIQPSQPIVGRLEGWPMRPYFKNSLHVDFECWCLKEGIPSYLIPSKELFYQETDLVFESIVGGKYHFPDLLVCREKFSKLTKERFHD